MGKQTTSEGLMGRRVLLKSSFSQFSGYGNDGIGLAIALQDAGFEVSLNPLFVQPPLPAQVAALFTRMIEPPYDFVLHHSDPSALGLSGAEEVSSDLRIAWTMWEFTGLGEAVTNEVVKTEGRERDLADRMTTYNMVLVYDEVTRSAMTPVLKDQRVEKLQGGYWSKGWEANPQERDWSGTFRYCMVGQLHQRKNPFASIEAFNMLKKEHGDEFDAELHLKTNIRSLHPSMEQAYPGVKIHYESWPKQQLKEFYLQCHCYLAPSWGEGKNLPALEAQTTGMPVIATNFGGHAEWMSDEWSYSVNYTIGEHLPGMGSARVDVAHLAEQMWHVYTHRDEARRKGELAARIIPPQMDWSRVIERLGDLTR